MKEAARFGTVELGRSQLLLLWQVMDGVDIGTGLAPKPRGLGGQLRRSRGAIVVSVHLARIIIMSRPFEQRDSGIHRDTSFMEEGDIQQSVHIGGDKRLWFLPTRH